MPAGRQHYSGRRPLIMKIKLLLCLLTLGFGGCIFKTVPRNEPIQELAPYGYQRIFDMPLPQTWEIAQKLLKSSSVPEFVLTPDEKYLELDPEEFLTKYDFEKYAICNTALNKNSYDNGTYKITSSFTAMGDKTVVITRAYIQSTVQDTPMQCASTGLLEADTLTILDNAITRVKQQEIIMANDNGPVFRKSGYDHVLTDKATAREFMKHDFNKTANYFLLE